MDPDNKRLSTHLPMPSQHMVTRARALRQSATSAEDLLWRGLRKRQLGGIKFRRQHPIDTFVADFFCDAARLVIEVDGAVHLEPTQQARDQVREQILREYQLAVVRFSNDDVVLHPEAVMNRIESTVLTEMSRRSKAPRTA